MSFRDDANASATGARIPFFFLPRLHHMFRNKQLGTASLGLPETEYDC